MNFRIIAEKAYNKWYKLEVVEQLYDSSSTILGFIGYLLRSHPTRFARGVRTRLPDGARARAFDYTHTWKSARVPSTSLWN